MSNFYDDPDNAETYVKMAEGYDGAELIAQLDKVLPAGASVLEIGMGPGIDFDLLAKRYAVTGSDLTAYFLDRYRKTHPEADLLELDAVTLATDRTFDALYSNKVLHHLDDEALAASVVRQRQLLNGDGFVCHSFWTGDTTEEMHGMQFHYRQPNSVGALFGDGWANVTTGIYEEFDAGDSFWVMAQRG